MKTYPKTHHLLGAVAAVSTGLAAAQPAPTTDDPRNALEPPQLQEMMEMLRDGGAGRGDFQPAPWQIGVMVVPLDPLLRMHLNLPEGAGVLVQQVMEGSPAKKAGLEPNDIIVVAGDRKIDNLPALKEVVTQAFEKGDSLDLAVIHQGKQRQITVRRDAGQDDARPAGRQGGPEERQQQQQFRQLNDVRQALQEMRRQLARQQRQINQLERRLNERPAHPRPEAAPTSPDAGSD